MPEKNATGDAAAKPKSEPMSGEEIAELEASMLEHLSLPQREQEPLDPEVAAALGELDLGEPLPSVPEEGPEETQPEKEPLPEVDYLKQQLGKQSGELGRLRKENEQLRAGRADQPAQQPATAQAPVDMETPENLARVVRLLYGADADPTEAFYKTAALGHIRAHNATVQAVQQILSGELAPVKESLGGLTSRFEEASARASLGQRIDPKVEAEILRENPELGDLPLKARLSMVARLAKARAGNGSTVPAKPNATRAVPARTAAEHVEGSATSTTSSAATATNFVEDQFEKWDEKKRTQYLSKLMDKMGPGVLYQR